MTLRIVRSVAELRAALSPLRAGRIGFVPTMGALHEGHLSLLRAAGAENDTVVLSIFVNPTQFTQATDLEMYPRTEQDDVALAAGAGAHLVFAPSVDEMYPTGFATTVSVDAAITETLEGAVRGRAHFDGVATVVAKLLLAVLPDRAYFGAKDAQQVVVVRRMVADLGIPVEIIQRPTSREDDGLARSSRNTRLSPEEREIATAVPRALRAAQDAFATGIRDAAALTGAVHDALDVAGLTPEYIALVDPDSLEPVASVARPALLAVAVPVGSVRLIDNVFLTPGIDDRIPLGAIEVSHR
ncbi:MULTISPECIES: pantoate--beta-alanine ligase [Microbacterium]|uniref:pantoate--beta-alanine ligase n=1 Tax=Microbacterium TaxID=33882 RepID=UPI00278021A9|nr:MULTISPECIES: pantoate--beta-alanine ligase [Microbacterium]MDQ1082842.1 pantoate--beta-alanine ligase [Microbacterium sp. SORGH_AS_0344]MDQ1168389.1 pantoate--beta-alanine ligase [Microbacterium proteolyticum]